MKRKILIFLCFILCIVSLASVSATNEITEINDNANELVDVSQDNAVNDLLSDNQVTSSDLKSEVVNDNVSLKKTEIIADDVVMYYKDGRRFSATLVDEDGNPLSGKSVSTVVNGVIRNYTTNEKGEFSFAINLIPDVYLVVMQFYGDSIYDSSVNSAHITVKQTLYSIDLVKMYGDSLKYIVLVSQNLTLENINLALNINGVIYYRTTGILGTASLAINLIPGKYVITTERLDTGEKLSNTIVVKPLLSENKDMDIYYRNGSAYSVKVTTQNGKVAGAGEEVTFNINGVFYTRTTNESGYANLNINLAPGEYSVTADYKGYKVNNKVKVKPVISASNLIKVYGSPDSFCATLVDGQGNPAPGKNVTFNINGVFYSKKTDDEGVARLNINLMPGEYIITSTSPNGNSISNKITVKNA